MEDPSCASFDLPAARVDALSSAWAAAVGLVPAADGATQRLISFARVNGVWRQAPTVLVPRTELSGLVATLPYPYLSTFGSKDFGVWWSNGTAYTPVA